MKKFISYLMCFFVGALLFTGCTAEKNEYQEKSFTADGNKITAVRIDVRDRKIEIVPSTDEKISIAYFENEKEYYQLEYADENTLVMTCGDNREWSDYVGRKAPQESRTIRLQVPDQKLATLELSTSNEDVSLPALTVTDSASIRTNNGNIKLERMAVGKKLELDAKNGNIAGTVVGSYDVFSISAKAKKGKSNLPEHKEPGEKILMASTNNGDITIAFE